MKSYIGAKIIQARLMNRGDYNAYKGWTIPENENPADEGYLVRYSGSYESWSPKAVFEEAYRLVNTDEADMVIQTRLSETCSGMVLVADNSKDGTVLAPEPIDNEPTHHGE